MKLIIKRKTGGNLIPFFQGGKPIINSLDKLKNASYDQSGKIKFNDQDLGLIENAFKNRFSSGSVDSYMDDIIKNIQSLSNSNVQGVEKFTKTGEYTPEFKTIIIQSALDKTYKDKKNKTFYSGYVSDPNFKQGSFTIADAKDYILDDGRSLYLAPSWQESDTHNTRLSEGSQLSNTAKRYLTDVQNVSMQDVRDLQSEDIPLHLASVASEELIKKYDLRNKLGQKYGRSSLDLVNRLRSNTSINEWRPLADSEAKSHSSWSLDPTEYITDPEDLEWYYKIARRLTRDWNGDKKTDFVGTGTSPDNIGIRFLSHPIINNSYYRVPVVSGDKKDRLIERIWNFDPNTKSFIGTPKTIENYERPEFKDGVNYWKFSQYPHSKMSYPGAYLFDINKHMGVTSKRSGGLIKKRFK